MYKRNGSKLHNDVFATVTYRKDNKMTTLADFPLLLAHKLKIHKPQCLIIDKALLTLVKAKNARTFMSLFSDVRYTMTDVGEKAIRCNYLPLFHFRAVLQEIF